MMIVKKHSQQSLFDKMSMLLTNYFEISLILCITQQALPPGGQIYSYYPGTLSCSQVATIHLKIGHP